MTHSADSGRSLSAARFLLLAAIAGLALGLTDSQLLESTDFGIEQSLLTGGLGKGQEQQGPAAHYGHPGGAAARKPRRDQFVVTIPTHQMAEGRVLATRASRLGMRTFIVTNYTAGIHTAGPARYPEAVNETWTSYPDDKPPRSYSVGDTRAALAPFLAFKHYSEHDADDFEWMFLGDDDTLFLAEAAATVVSTLDPKMPIWLTDNAWFSSSSSTHHPHKDALRCVPCNYARNMSQLPMKMVRGCPCTPEVMCNLKGGYKGIVNAKACGPPRSPSVAYSMHGGSGALLSIGLLRAVPFAAMEQCILSQWNSGADAYITICLWQMGYAMTDPDPLYHPEGQVMFDPTPEPFNTDAHILPKAAHFLGNLLRALQGMCTGICELELSHTVSLHVRAVQIVDSPKDSQKLKEAAAQEVLRALSRSYANFAGAAVEYEKSRPAWPLDMNDHGQAALAARVEERFKAGQRLISDMEMLFKDEPELKDAFRSGIDPLLSTATPGIGTLDRARSGAAAAVALQVLNTVLQDVTHSLSNGAVV